MVSLVWFVVPVLVHAAPSPPITVDLAEKGGYATFTNRLHPGNRIGYRFHEHTPMVWGDVPADNAAAGIDPESVARLEASFAARTGVVVHVTDVREAEWAQQQWKHYLVPVEDGVEMLWVVETNETGLNRYYGVQQCFRMGGVTNQAWRRAIAETPAFSEFDLWQGPEKEAAVKTSLTYVPRRGAWEALPALKETVGARTPRGLAIDTERTGGHLESMPEVGPYHAKMLEPVDDGTIVRADKDKTWVCGIRWEATSHVTDHHPADCLHAIVNIGGIPPHSKRALRGKILWFKGSPQEVASHSAGF